MIALDSNVLLRYVIDDDPIQSARACRLIDSELTATVPGFLSLVVLCETIWAMTQTYDLPRANVVRTLEGLLSTSRLEIEARDIVRMPFPCLATLPTRSFTSLVVGTVAPAP